MKKTLILTYLVLLVSCSDKTIQVQLSNNTEIKEKNIDSLISIPKIERNLNSLSLDSLWTIITQKSSCLTGGQYEINGEFRSEGCVMDESKEWEVLLKEPKKNITEFLLTKLEKTDTTNVHTCPFFLSTEGELAVYTLQRIYKKNWFDFEEFKTYRERAEEPQKLPISNKDNYQGWLQNEVLQNPQKRELLKNIWIAEMNNSNE